MLLQDATSYNPRRTQKQTANKPASEVSDGLRSSAEIGEDIDALFRNDGAVHVKTDRLWTKETVNTCVGEGPAV